MCLLKVFFFFNVFTKHKNCNCLLCCTECCAFWNVFSSCCVLWNVILFPALLFELFDILENHSCLAEHKNGKGGNSYPGSVQTKQNLSADMSNSRSVISCSFNLYKNKVWRKKKISVSWGVMCHIISSLGAVTYRCCHCCYWPRNSPAHSHFQKIKLMFSHYGFWQAAQTFLSDKTMTYTI